MTQTCWNCGFVTETGATNKLTLTERNWTSLQGSTYCIRNHKAARNVNIQFGQPSDTKDFSN